MEALYSGRLDALAEPLAGHFEAGEAWDKAAGYLLQAAETAKSRYTYREGLGFSERALAAAEAGALAEERVRALVLRGDLASLTDDLEGANESYAAALENEPDPARRPAIENRVHRERTAVRDGARIVFHEHGRGDETLVFVNPVFYSGSVLQPLVEMLCDEFRIITYFPRGTGLSDPLERPYTVKDHAEDVRAVIEALDVGPVIGIGISRGGQVLFNLVHDHPGLVKKIVGVGTPPGQMAAEGTIGRSKEMVIRFEYFLEKRDFDGLYRYWGYNILSEPETGDMAEAFIENCRRLSLETMKSFFDLDPDLDVVPLLGDITQPVLITHGTEDKQILFEAAPYLVERLPSAQLYAFEGRGHLPLFTATAEFCHVLRQFVREGTVPEIKKAAE
jgi:pimeloyl-ACP methyl ester carboxylesterase